MPGHRYVFIAGLHRTGTSLLAQLLGQNHAIATIEDAPVPENEGCYLQGAIPHTARDGMPGHYATDPRQHLTELHPLNSLQTKRRLEAEWGEWFAPSPSAAWRLEKSPVNLTRMRLLQGLFPLAQFVVITRHPAAMAQALRKWTDRPVAEIEEYGVQAYRKALDDMRYLHAAVCVRYEDLVASPARIMAGLHRFLDCEPMPADAQLKDGNADYPAIHSSRIEHSELGYKSGGACGNFTSIVQHPLRSIREGAEAEFCKKLNN